MPNAILLLEATQFRWTDNELEFLLLVINECETTENGAWKSVQQTLVDPFRVDFYNDCKIVARSLANFYRQ